MSKLLKNVNFLITAQRSASNCKYNWRNEGIQYFGFKYYPKDPDFKDPPYQPSKLFKVQRIKELKGTSKYERLILRHLNLTGKTNEVVIIKNIPELNQRLWRVKHLVKIEPITFPDGFPTDNRGTYLRENGELKVKKVLESFEEKLKLTEEFVKKPEKLDGPTLRRESRLRWLSGWQ